MADVGGGERDEATVTIGELLAERIALTQPRTGRRANTAHAGSWIDQINATLSAVTGDRAMTVESSSTLDVLPELERAVALAAVALAEGTRVVLLDKVDAFTSNDDESAFLAAVATLAHSSTTVVVGTPVPARIAPTEGVSGRAITTIDLYSVSRKEALR
jgi:RND superfamily putative drug exporter